jgi:dephospho-CoA kinase
MLTVTAIYLLLLPLFYYLRSSRLRLFEIVGLNVPAHDLELMKRSFADAREVTIFSGDFSFLTEDEQLLEELRFLGQKERLVLVSHKSREEVFEAVKLHHHARSLIEALIQANRIRFKSGLGVHCSVVHKWDHREVLYRYLSPERSRVSDYNMCILVGRREARPILDAIEMVRGRWAQFGTPWMSKNAKGCIVVLGQARSGKTTMAEYVASFGFAMVSASSVMKDEFCRGASIPQGRRALMECGAKVLGDGNDQMLGERIFNRCSLHDQAVVDGIRFRGTFEALRARAGTMRTIYVDCPIEVRRARFVPAIEGITFEEVQRHITESAVQEMKDLADLQISGARRLPDVEEAVREFLAKYGWGA